MLHAERVSPLDGTKLLNGCDTGVRTRLAYASPRLTLFGDIRGVTMGVSGKEDEFEGGKYN